MPTCCEVCGVVVDDCDVIGEHVCHFVGGRTAVADACVDFDAGVVPVRLGDVHVHPFRARAATTAAKAPSERRPSSAPPISKCQVVPDSDSFALVGGHSPGFVKPLLKSIRSAEDTVAASATTARKGRYSTDEDSSAKDDAEEGGGDSSGGGDGGGSTLELRYYQNAEVRSAVEAARAAATVSMVSVGTAATKIAPECIDGVNDGGDFDNVSSTGNIYDAKCEAKSVRSSSGGASMKPAPKAKVPTIATEEEAERSQLEGCKRYGVRYLAPPSHSSILEKETLGERRERYFQMQQLRDEAYHREKASPFYGGSNGKGRVAAERRSRDACLRLGVAYLPPPVDVDKEKAEDRNARLKFMANARQNARHRMGRWAAVRNATARARLTCLTDEEAERCQLEGCRYFGIRYLPPPQGCIERRKERMERYLKMQLFRNEAYREKVDALTSLGYVKKYSILGREESSRESCLRYGVRYLPPPTNGNEETVQDRKARIMVMTQAMRAVRKRTRRRASLWEASDR